MRRLLALAFAFAFVVVAAGCGGSGDDRPDQSATLLLDFMPNAVHSGIYLARVREYDVAEGVRLRIRKPGASTDALKLLQAGRANFAILDIHDLGLARQGGADLVGVMALVQRPLAAVIAQPDVRRPRELAGRRVGVTGLPSDDAVLRSVVAGDGGDPDRVRATTIGFQAVRALLARRVDGATAFWNVEGVALKRQRPQIREFRVDDYGAPRYPELVLCVTRDTLEDHPSLIRATVRALQRGYGEAQVDPESAIAAVLDAQPGVGREELSAQMDAVGPAFTAGAAAFGQLRRDVLREWAEWDVEFGILERPLDVERAFDTGFVGPSRR